MEDIELKAHEAWGAGNLNLAFELFSEGARQGLDGCMLDLGYFYDEGVGIAIDKNQAMYWYKKAYRLGNSSAASNIAILYREQGCFNLTAQWFKRAIQLSDGDAEVELAKLLISGKGVRKSFSVAKVHLLNALASNHITPAGKQEAEELLCKVQNGL
ncbi:tetratricopeptide repeat protein [Ectopseudomonas khazarica]|uniref:tetratricopeptide repeat protein n=1 Tax=Ectopseudomonas khazarica TaxID=2502979 RepID=UPI003A9129A5